MKNSIIINDILSIKQRIINLSNNVLEQHKKAFHLLNKYDKAIVENIYEIEEDIDLEAVNIKNEISFILTKEPLAKYLRRAISYLIISKELERIADYAKHIARFTEKIQKPSKSSIRRIQDIYSKVLEMLKQLSHNIEIEDNKELLKLINDDDLVDIKCTEVNKELVVSFSTSQHSEKEVHERLYILNLVNGLERAGDHVVNICDSIYYIINGRYIKM
ncbi:phosphate signaling complex PhoU family protein [Mycoplasmopsis lipofaciens]|uniref:phosphate signaling complex PhoU family protein n=1 Tax=Mycoplasmopsis lipofaciens TaxID=114884 RepID=UPI0004823A26|nr:PhoU domain-containing protein [Mycoplasmopsis lipofaciens]